MSYIALYRKWRPLIFEDVVEQEHVVKTLKNSVISGRIAHAYLFCGTRGTGKTTTAKILSRAINCLNPNEGDPCNKCEICRGILSGSILDVIEIDAASNNSVDNVREIRDEIVYTPSRARYKVYIIDEVHMLSQGAFNALLKTLEEPPAHVVFILATTEPHKLPPTILSRCQRFDFRRITMGSIMRRLEEIARDNGVPVQKEALRLIARLSDGAMRDAISILDQCLSTGSREISYDDVLSVVGMVNDSFMGDVVDAVNERDIVKIIGLIDRLVFEGRDIAHFVSDLVLYYRNLLICKISDKPSEIIDVFGDVMARMQKQCAGLERDWIIHIIKELSELEAGLKWASHPRVMLEVTLIKLCDQKPGPDNTDIVDRIAALERKLGSIRTLCANVSGTESAITAAAGSVNRAGENKADGVQKTAPTSPKATELLYSGTPDKTVENWEEILNELKSNGKMGIYTHLIGTRAVELNEGLIGIVFSGESGFNRIYVSKAENMEIIEKIASSKLGREVRIKCIDEPALPSRHTAGSKAGEKGFVERAEDFARKLNVPLEIIDE